jgi:hypothetical protein
MKPVGKACKRKGMGEGDLKGPGSKRSMPAGAACQKSPSQNGRRRNGPVESRFSKVRPLDYPQRGPRPCQGMRLVLQPLCDPSTLGHDPPNAPPETCRARV